MATFNLFWNLASCRPKVSHLGLEVANSAHFFDFTFLARWSAGAPDNTQSLSNSDRPADHYRIGLAMMSSFYLEFF